ncbi:hypothetical protein TIFTF001_028077 [Ficus carica]|uniref:Phorbol-ester/DAG-type domain-containing protein n=1 Tax=Ficus carica TaxID=3494 RepID=A0AA88J103_FICCA|nr:hypothetical protein TIFTF001_028077 [Ficus carica]
MDQIQHWSHEHPLFLRKNHKINDERCGMCDKEIVAPYNYYACDACKFYVHKSCAELPPHINHHPFHPSHPLSLHSHPFYYCDSCHQLFENALTFGCGECYFNMDVECALIPHITCEGREHIQHFLVEVDSKDNITYCFVCHSTDRSGGFYCCTKCKLLLHKSCAALPQKIRHPLHPNHSLLTLCVLCVKCVMKVKGTIRYEDHEHLLCLLEETYTKLAHCDGYDAYCKQPVTSTSTEIDHTRLSILRCSECDFWVHLLCGPLPSTIEYKYHIHPLTLVDSLVDDNSGEYYCDICESERDPRIRVYHCQECQFVAHVHCLISEGDLRDVKLKTVGADFWELPDQLQQFNKLTEEDQPKSSLTFRDLLNNLPQNELRWFRREDFEWETSSDEEENKGKQEVSESNTHQRLLDLGDESIDELLRFSSFTQKDFRNFTSALKRNFDDRKLKIKSSDLAMKIVDVEGYMVPFTLAPVLKILLHKYGDIFRNSNRSQEMKSIAFCFVCKVVKQMHSTMVLNITKDLLQDWYFYLEFASWRVKSDIDFLKAPLEKITRAFFGFQLRKLKVDVPRTINKKIAELQSKIAELQSKIAEQKRKLEACQKFKGTSRKPKFMNECLNEAAQLEWKYASGV